LLTLPKKALKYLKLFALKKTLTGEDNGTKVGELVLIKMENQ
jgi:hypothetical protein